MNQSFSFQNCDVKIAQALVNQASSLIKDLNLGERFLLVTDEKIKIATKFLHEDLINNLSCEELIFSDDIIASYDLSLEIIKQSSDIDVLIAVGSGTINDLVKYAAFKLKKPYILFATAPSMNGYLSANASLVKDNSKTSFKAKLARAAFFDLDILANAPLDMIKAGLGDSICSSTVQCDLLLSHFLLNTSYNANLFEIQKATEYELFSNASLLIKRDPEIIYVLVELLLLSGIAMTKEGSSSPASQGEHMIAHIMNGLTTKKNLHGLEIAVTTIMMASLQEKILFSDSIPQLKSRQKLSNEQIKDTNFRLKNNWQEYSVKLKEIHIAAEELKMILSDAEISYDPKDLRWNQKTLKDITSNVHLSRDRFTFLNFE